MPLCVPLARPRSAAAWRRRWKACYGDRRASVANELALLWDAARDDARAADYFLQAARSAAQIHAQREAAQLAERGLRRSAQIAGIV